MKGRMLNTEIKGQKLSGYLPDTKQDCVCCYLLCGDCAQGLMTELAHGMEKQWSGRPLALISMDGIEWDRDYTPWPAQGPGGRAFTGGAAAFLNTLKGNIIPWAEAELPILKGRTHRFLAGYSLGGLAALYGALEGESFGRAASVSGSLWYPGWMDYLQARSNDALMPERVYASLGKAESKTRFGPMAACAEHTHQTVEWMRARLGAEKVCFEWNNGPHFFELPERMMKALRNLSL